MALTAERAPGLTALIVAEQACCSFLDFTPLRFAGATVVMTLTAPNDAQEIVSDLIAVRNDDC